MSRTEYEILDIQQGRAQDAKELPASLETTYNLWLELADGNFAPSWRDFRLDKLPAKLIPWAIIMDVIDEGADFRYRFYSAERSALRKMDRTGLMLSVYEPPVFREKVMGEYRKTLKAREPLVFTTTVSVPGEDPSMPYEPKSYAIMRMPMSLNGVTVDRMFSLDAAEYARDWEYRFMSWQNRYTR